MFYSPCGCLSADIIWKVITLFQSCYNSDIQLLFVNIWEVLTEQVKPVLGLAFHHFFSYSFVALHLLHCACSVLVVQVPAKLFFIIYTV